MINKKKFRVLLQVKVTLNGYCSGNKETCPCYVADKLYPNQNIWICKDCEKTFGFLINKDKYKSFKHKLRRLYLNTPCPCLYCHDENEVFLALDEELANLYGGEE